MVTGKLVGWGMEGRERRERIGREAEGGVGRGQVRRLGSGEV